MPNEVKLLPCEVVTDAMKRAGAFAGAAYGHPSLYHPNGEMLEEIYLAMRAARPTTVVAGERQDLGASADADRATHERGQSPLSPPSVGIPSAAFALPLGGYPVPETVTTREHALHCFACGGALSHSCVCERVTLHRDGLASLIFWVQTDTASAIEARRAADSEAGAVHESAVGSEASETPKEQRHD